MENTISVSFNTDILEEDADVPLPSSKSISNRLLVMQHIAGKKFHLKNVSASDDTVLMRELLEEIRDNEGSDEEVELDVSNAGTVMRFLTALLSFTDGQWLLTGSERMKNRPVAPLVDALRSLGASIEYTETPNYPPIRISGSRELCKTQNAIVEIDATLSSQFISAIMMVAPMFQNGLHIALRGTNKVSVPYIQMTASLMRSCGIKVEFIDNSNIFAEGRYSTPENSCIENDWSAASYMYAFLALSDKGVLHLPYLYEDSVQGDKIIADWFEDFGIETVFNHDGIVVTKKSNEISRSPRSYDFTHHPDIAQTIAVVCVGLGLEARITGIHSLKHKETDRIAAVSNELRRIGANVEYNTKNDELHIIGSSQNGLRINTKEPIRTYGDHRMAMAFATLAARYDNIKIENPQVVSKSFPDFWDVILK
ncbi:MAG: 3-phosphoshikimate 1-carboxyvinyltransferase [Bacteroidales bacterium]|jgi:3-phosphoshikimate 1-carboxyvinyltransferase|nr:3-phosphoshikimate 1-carboxyvinyltransferase [Bacteroidales bacterium]